MILNKLSRGDAEKLATDRGFEIESDQNGIKRIVVDGIVIEAGRYGGNLELSVPATPKKVKKYRLTTTVKAKDGDIDVVLGDFDREEEAVKFEDLSGGTFSKTEIAEVEVEVSE